MTTSLLVDFLNTFIYFIYSFVYLSILFTVILRHEISTNSTNASETGIERERKVDRDRVDRDKVDAECVCVSER